MDIIMKRKLSHSSISSLEVEVDIISLHSYHFQTSQSVLYDYMDTPINSETESVLPQTFRKQKTVNFHSRIFNQEDLSDHDSQMEISLINFGSIYHQEIVENEAQKVFPTAVDKLVPTELKQQKPDKESEIFSESDCELRHAIIPRNFGCYTSTNQESFSDIAFKTSENKEADLKSNEEGTTNDLNAKKVQKKIRKIKVEKIKKEPRKKKEPKTEKRQKRKVVEFEPRH